ncbi:phage tail protein [Streptomyces scabiei]|uniref:phage tail protein n=1 Tax=Streptomyces scabiei TaxID=1930 RepID=UPI0039F0AA00
MAGPGGREIARLAARVLPDTSRFATSLQAYLDRIERRAQVKVKATPDMTGFTRDLQTHLAAVREQIDVPVTPDMRRFQTTLQAAVATARRRVRVSVPVVPDVSGFTADTQARLASVRAQVDIPVVPDLSRFQATLRAAIAATRQRVRVPVDLDISQAAIAAAQAQLRGRTVQLEATLTVSRIALLQLRRRLARNAVRMPVRLDLTRGQVRTLQRQLRSSTLRVPVSIHITRAEIRRLQAELSRHRFHITVDIDRRATDQIQRTLNGIGNATGGGGGGALGGGGLALLPGRIAAIATAAASALPSVASLVGSLVQMAPAAALAAPALLALITAGAALAVGAKGVGEALKNAFDPANAEKYQEALAKLTPNARAFVEALKGAGPQFTAIRKAVQERLFEGLAKQVTAAGKVALPVLKRGLVGTAGALNAMGTGVLGAARQLADSGQLGKAISGANKGLGNLAKIPGQFVTGLTQIGVAAAPAFDRLTQSAGGAATRLADKISAGLESGKLTAAIDQAIDLAGQLFDVLGNLGTIFKNVFGPAAEAGGGFLGILQEVTGELTKVTATKGVQDALSALFETMAQLGRTAAPLIGQALSALGPVLTQLGPPAQLLIKSLGSALQPVIKALGPVLAEAAGAVAALVTAAAPLLPVVGQLAASLLPALQPLLAAAADIFTQLAPVVQQVADVLGPTLQPIVQGLSDVLVQLVTQGAKQFLSMLQQLLPVVPQLTPVLLQLGESVGQILTQLAPLLPKITLLGAQLAGQLLPAILPLIPPLAQFASILIRLATGVITSIVIPALSGLIDFITGMREKLQPAIDAVTYVTGAIASAFTWLYNLLVGHSIIPDMVNGIVSWISSLPGAIAGALASFVASIASSAQQALAVFLALPGQAASALGSLPGLLAGAATSAGRALLGALRAAGSQAIAVVRQIPGMAAAALGGLGGVLASAGASLISGFISGIQSKIGAVRSTLSSLTSQLPDWKGPAKKDARILTPAGRLLIEGFIRGIDGTTARLRQRLETITRALPANVKSGYGKSLKKATTELSRLVTQRDRVIKDLAAAEKKLKSLAKERDANAKKIREGILSEADITKAVTGGPTTAQSIAEQLRAQLKAAQDFANQIARLRKRGLRADLLDQLGQAGVEQGGAAAAALSGASDAQLREINKLQKQLSAAASKTGNTVADAMYDSGVQAAKGLVAGLKKQKKAIEQAMISIAKSMQKALRAALGINSPARKLIPDGINTVRGVLVGVDRERPKLLDAMASLVAIPNAPALSGSLGAAVAGGAGMAGQRLRLAVRDREFDAFLEEVADGRVSDALTTVRRRNRAGKKG